MVTQVRFWFLSLRFFWHFKGLPWSEPVRQRGLLRLPKRHLHRPEAVGRVDAPIRCERAQRSMETRAPVAMEELMGPSAVLPLC